MQPPAKTPLPDAAVITQTLHDAPASAGPSISDPVQLFAADYDAANGDLTNLTPSPQRTIDNSNVNRSIAGTTRPLPPSADRPPHGKRVTSSPRRAMLAAARVVTQLSQPLATSLVGPPALRRDGPSPTSVIAAVLPHPSPPPAIANEPPPANKPKRNHKSFRGHVPKSDFIKFARPLHFGTGDYDAKTIKKGLNQCRIRIFHQFTKTSNRGETSFVDSVVDMGDGPVTRSSVEDEEDWVIDQSAMDVTTTDTRRLSLYCFEQLLMCRERDKFLILVRVSSDKKLFKGGAQTIASVQGTTTLTISGVEYYRRKATISDATHNANARGEGLPYSESDFQRDFNKKDGEFEVRFDGTDLILGSVAKRHLQKRITWLMSEERHWKLEERRQQHVRQY